MPTARRPPKLLDADGLLGYAMKTLSGRALSQAEMRTRLRKKAALPADVDLVMAKLDEYGFVNDQRMAEHVATVRRDSYGVGKGKVLRELAARRIAPGAARTAVDQAYADVDEPALVEQYLERKFRGKNLTELLQDERKLAGVYRRLRYAGFSSGASVGALKRWAARADELEDSEG